MRNSAFIVMLLLMTTAVHAQSESMKADMGAKEPANPSMYPNPASDIVYIEHERPITEILVFDILGQSAGEFQTTGNRNYVLDISELKKGVYFVRIKDEDNIVYSRKLIRQ